ncbi:MAG: AAA family ATPase [bacterium]
MNKRKKEPPCIVFIDEIDAVGRQRGAGLGGGNDEREQTLNQILAEMDGFKSNSGVILIAASNRPDVLDAALLRPGRFDRKIYVPSPDINGRFAILKVHTKDKTLEESTDLMVIARGTPGATGADLANIINEAALLAARENKTAIGMSHIEQAKDKISMGRERRIAMSAKETRNTAIHETGHAIVILNSKNADPLHKVSIIPRGPALGVTMQLPIDDRSSTSRAFIIDFVKILLGGRAAEEIFFGPDYVTTGARNDLERATALLKDFVSKYGLDEEFGLAAFGDSGSNPFLGREMALHSGMSQGTQEESEKRTRVLLQKYYEEAKKIIEDKKNDVEKLAEALLEKETLSASEIKELLGYA